MKAKAEERVERAQLRTNRQTARLSSSDVQHQLSTQNYHSLTTAITQSDRELELKKNGLMSTVHRTGYIAYLDRLTNYLQSQQTTLTFHEQEALKQIIRHMQDHLQKKSDEQCEISRLHTEQGKKGVLENGLHANQAQLARLKQSNPELRTQNQQLAAQNQQLMLDVKKQQGLKNKSLKASEISLLASSATLAFGGALMFYFVPTVINLILLFAPAVGIAAVTVGFLIAALVYTLQHRSSKSQLQKNNDIISRNNSTIDSQGDTIKNLENVVIPDVQDKIKQAEATVAHIQAEIRRHGETAALHLDSATKVSLIMTSAANSSAFLPAPAPDALPPAYTALPSAPEEDVADQTVLGVAP